MTPAARPFRVLEGLVEVPHVQRLRRAIIIPYLAHLPIIVAFDRKGPRRVLEAALVVDRARAASHQNPGKTQNQIPSSRAPRRRS